VNYDGNSVTGVLELCRAIQETAVGSGIRESELVFPVIETAHVLALTLSVGTIMWFDLRLAGFAMQDEPVSRVFLRLRPWMIAGFAVMLTTGVLMFMSLAVELYASRYFRIKLVLLALAGLNIVLYHFTIDRSRQDWDTWAVPPTRARLAGVVSLVLWFAIIAAGRLTAYSV
jgi:hypothetical protein